MGDLMSYAQVYARYGINPSTLRALAEEGALPGGDRCTEEDIASLRGGVHYVICMECGKFAREITSSHLRVCCGLTRTEYVLKHPDAPWCSAGVASRKAKTPAQKVAQSEKLKARFKTPEGERTRQEIASASKRMQEGDYGSRAAAHLRELNARPEQKAARSAESRKRWDSGAQREAIATWQKAHPDQVLTSAAHARRHIQKHYTKLHAQVKVALVASGLSGFITEYEVGFYSIDEAMPGIRIAVEVDGCWWHGCDVCGHPGVKNIQHTDARKTLYLTNRGWTVIRLAEHDIKADIDGCVRRVWDVVERLSTTRGAA